MRPSRARRATSSRAGWSTEPTCCSRCPIPRETKKAIQALDFIAVVDVLPVEMAGWADVVLPESTYLERCDEVWAPAYEQPFLAVRQPAVEPMYESKPGWWIAKQLGHRLGLSDYFPWKDSVEYAIKRVKSAGYDCDKLRTTGVVLGKKVPVSEEEGLALSFDTDSKKIELYSEPLEGRSGFTRCPSTSRPRNRQRACSGCFSAARRCTALDARPTIAS